MKTPDPCHVEGFEIFRQIGFGLQARVYEARSLELGRPVALKVFEDTSSARLRFTREREAYHKLTEENRSSSFVPRLLTSSDAGTPYLVIELVHGMSLARVIKWIGSEFKNHHRIVPPTWGELMCEVRSLVAAEFTTVEKASWQAAPQEPDRPFRESVESLTMFLLELLELCHKLGIWHRDIKPGNILLTVDEEFRVIDFESAVLDSMDRVTGAHEPPGTMGYCDSRSEGFRYDLHSLCVTVYEFWSGVSPRIRPNRNRWFQRVKGLPMPTPLHGLRLPDGFRGFLRRGGHPVVAFRPKTPAQALAAFRSYTTGNSPRPRFGLAHLLLAFATVALILIASKHAQTKAETVSPDRSSDALLIDKLENLTERMAQVQRQLTEHHRLEDEYVALTLWGDVWDLEPGIAEIVRETESNEVRSALAAAMIRFFLVSNASAFIPDRLRIYESALAKENPSHPLLDRSVAYCLETLGEFESMRIDKHRGPQDEEGVWNITAPNFQETALLLRKAFFSPNLRPDLQGMFHGRRLMTMKRQKLAMDRKAPRGL